MLLTTNGIVYAWGVRDYQQTGVDMKSNMDPNKPLDRNYDIYEPNKVSSIGAVDIFTGGNFSFLAVKSKDNKIRIKGWGDNTYGQLGLGHIENEGCYIPKNVKFDDDVSIVSVAGGSDHCIALTDKNEVYSWGRNDENQCGFTTNFEYNQETGERNLYESIPKKLNIFDNKENKVNQIVAKGNVNYAFNLATGKVFSWGFGEGYVLGNKKEENENCPYEIPKDFYYNLYVSHLAIGSSHVVVNLEKTPISEKQEKQGQIEDKIDDEENSQKVIKRFTDENEDIKVQITKSKKYCNVNKDKIKADKMDIDEEHKCNTQVGLDIDKKYDTKKKPKNESQPVGLRIKKDKKDKKKKKDTKTDTSNNIKVLKDTNKNAKKRQSKSKDTKNKTKEEDNKISETKEQNKRNKSKKSQNSKRKKA